jgi:hypothetical protein
MKKRLALIISVLGLLLSGSASAADTGSELLDILVERGTITEAEAKQIAASEPPSLLKGLSIGALAYVDYSFGQRNQNATHFNEFTLTRGYINIKKEITPWFRARITPDVTQVSSGDWELRMKYLYADFLPPDLRDLVTDNDIRVGLAETPWLNFEESINIYRMQGTMFQERNNIQNDADIGVAVLGNLGGKLRKAEQEEVGYATPYSGMYGSYHIGVYNGSGYKAVKQNQKKNVEGRITIRPLPDMLPGLQLTYAGVCCAGNTSEFLVTPRTKRWMEHTGFISYQNRTLVLTAEYVFSKGEQAGKDEFDGKGYSFFGDFRLPFYNKVSAFARYDHWNPGTTSATPGTQFKQNTVLGGLGYRIYNNNYVIAAYENVHYDQPGTADDKKAQLVLQLSF